MWKPDPQRREGRGEDGPLDAAGFYAGGLEVVAEVEGPARRGSGPLSSKCRACRCLPNRARLSQTSDHRGLFPRRPRAYELYIYIYIPGRKGSPWFTPGPFIVYLKKKRRRKKKTAAFTGNRRNFKSAPSPLTFSANVAARRCCSRRGGKGVASDRSNPFLRISSSFLHLQFSYFNIFEYC